MRIYQSWTQVLSRVLAAGLGGYAVAWALVFALGVWLPLARVSLWFLMGQILPVPLLLALLWAFAASSAARAWGWLLALATLLAGLGYLGKVLS